MTELLAAYHRAADTAIQYRKQGDLECAAEWSEEASNLLARLEEAAGL